MEFPDFPAQGRDDDCFARLPLHLEPHQNGFLTRDYSLFPENKRPTTLLAAVRESVGVVWSAAGPSCVRAVPAPCPLRARGALRMPRGHGFPVLLLAAAFGTSAVTLRRRDSSDPLDPGWRGKDGYYLKGDGVYCQKCPAGTYIAEECKEQNGSGRCEPCAYGEYMEYPNAFQWCRDCLKCREDLWAILAIGAPILLVIAFCLWKHHCSSPGDGRPSSRRPYEMVSSMFRKLSWYRRVNMGAEDNAANERIRSQQHHTATETPEMQSGSTKKSLVPVPGHDPILVLRRSFYVFARKVSKDNWKKFGRSLDLEENDVIMATSDDGFYEMLYKWLSREGSKSSVNTLLETLDRLHLGGVAEDISSTLVQDGLFQYEMS
ncbi:PREDICTED: tumor necrosis factor receptor superfamily member 10B isoform X2 [Pseudopodoces humilis]|uniref:tumor necrosis factor receptor superfamily member 10B isoform X2 n=1 Tax=Pseudopodoces humilis TaxID=181119 RepID=UPI0006B839D2|nr:PREDICTED: tumor necrosis factor receptor superfamily member 10B isoform X2 [Pseudopodoces humilis]